MLKSRRKFVSAMIIAGMAAKSSLVLANQQGESAMPTDPLIDLLTASKTDKRGVTLALGSGSVAMVVTEITEAHVMGRSQQYDRIVVRVDKIQAAYG